MGNDIEFLLNWLKPQTVFGWIAFIALILLIFFVLLIATQDVSKIIKNIIIIWKLGKKKIIATIIILGVIIVGGFIVDKCSSITPKEQAGMVIVEDEIVPPKIEPSKTEQPKEQIVIPTGTEQPTVKSKGHDTTETTTSTKTEQPKSETISVKIGETKTAFDYDVRISIETIQKARQLRIIGYINNEKINIEDKITKEIENYKIQVIDLDTICATFKITKKN